MFPTAPHDVLGIVYIRQKLLVKAEEEFLLALAANPRDPAARQGLLLLKSAATQLRQQQPPAPQQKPSAPKAEKAPPKTK
jgi:hypothetical protein